MFEIFRRVKHKKKGSLSLSINAIVVLVLAIAMLGLGLAFTKTMFSKFRSSLVVPPPDIPASADEPIILPSDEIRIKHSESVTFSVNFYNDYSGGTVQSAIECNGLLHPLGIRIDNAPTGAKPGLGITTGTIDGVDCKTAKAETCNVIAAPQRVDTGESKTFKFIVPAQATSTDRLGTDVCEILFCAPGSGNSVGSFSKTSGPTFGECDGHLETRQVVITVT